MFMFDGFRGRRGSRDSCSEAAKQKRRLGLEKQSIRSASVAVPGKWFFLPFTSGEIGKNLGSAGNANGRIGVCRAVQDYRIDMDRIFPKILFFKIFF
jgi:hypothetical protein